MGVFRRECGFYSLLLPLAESSAPVTLHRLHLDMDLWLLLFILGGLGSVFGNKSVKEGPRRRHSEQSVPRVLMTKCPLNSRCVRRNFCDENGLMTTNRNNKLTFSEDNRGLIACVDAGRNRLGVCCIDKFRVINGRRKVRQDDVLKVSEDGVLTLDTLPRAVDDGLTDEEEDILEDEFSFSDTIKDNPILSDDTRKDTKIVLNDESIESIVETVKAKGGKNPIIMVTDQEDVEENVAVRFLQPGQIAGFQGGPIVVINIHADSLGLGGRNGDLNLKEIRNKLLEATKSKPVELKESIPVTLDENITEIFEEEETEDYMDAPDYLDFDTDYITITMETDYGDRSSFFKDNIGNNLRRQLARRPGVVGSLRNRRPNRRPSRPRRPVFRFRTNHS